MEWQKKPFILTLLAPAEQCNQRCPRCYLTEVRHEPVTSFTLSPDSFRQAVVSLIENDIHILTVSFQGYEVTLPKSWPYVESVFRETHRRAINRSFVTNGMRLHTYTDRIVEHNPNRIGVSLDGADSKTNDYHRGLGGAFKRTLKSLGFFLEKAPQFRNRITIVSVLYQNSNAKSLMQMPKLLADYGITKWGLGLEVSASGNGTIRLADDPEKLGEVLNVLNNAAKEQGISFFVGDEFGLIDPQILDIEAIKRVPSSVEFLRLLPSGHVYWGGQAMKNVSKPDDQIWNPNTETFFEFLNRQQDINDQNKVSHQRSNQNAG